MQASSIILIYFDWKYSVNGIEWVGKRFNVTKKAVRNILAECGTALPEGVVTLVAVAFGTTPGQKNIGIPRSRGSLKLE